MTVLFFKQMSHCLQKEGMEGRALNYLRGVNEEELERVKFGILS